MHLSPSVLAVASVCGTARSKRTPRCAAEWRVCRVEWYNKYRMPLAPRSLQGASPSPPPAGGEAAVSSKNSVRAFASLCICLMWSCV